MRVPLIFRHTGRIAGDQTSEIPINQFDFFPTILEYLGFADIKVENSPGESFTEVLSGPDELPERRAIFHEYITIRVVRTERWLYQKAFMLGEDALYDLESDPGQRENLVGQPEYNDIVTQLDRRLNEFFRQYADPRYDLWQGGTAKLRLLGADDQEIFAQRFPGWQTPGLGFDQTVYSD